MTLTENVTYLPIEKIGRAIRDGYERTLRGASEWVEGSLIVATNLYMAREQFGSDQYFGRWLRESKYNFYRNNDRAALIAMGSNVQVMREVLNKRTSNSYRLIYQAEKSRFTNPGKPNQATDHAQKKPKYTRKTQRRDHKRTSTALKLAIRREKLGSIYAKIEHTSLGETREMEALLKLRQASPQQATALVERATAGEPVSAIAVVAAIKRTPSITSEQLIEAWKHCKILRLWLQAKPEAQDALITYQQNNRSK
jgi:hypothetical protein